MTLPSDKARHPAEEIPLVSGELLNGAPIHVRYEGWDEGTHEWDEHDLSGTYHAGWLIFSYSIGEHVVTDQAELPAPSEGKVWLRLDDPAGLGVQVLAACVAEASGYSLGPGSDVGDLVRWLVARPWCRAHSNWARVDVLRWAASYLTLSRLVCGTSLTPLKPGEVATLERHRLGYWLARGPGWSMTLGQAGRDTDDPLAALRMALEL